MTVCGADTIFDTLYKTLHEIHKTYKTYCTHKISRETLYKPRHSICKPQYSLCFSHQINIADCTRKINWELTLLGKLTIDTDTTSAVRTPTKHTTSAAEHAIKHAAEHMIKHVAEHVALHTPIKNLFSVTRKPLDISMISVALFNHFIQKSQKNLRI